MGGVSAPTSALRALAALVVLFGVACAGPRGTVHEVRPGENLYRISLHYGVPVERIARENRIRNARDLSVGTRLVIPVAQRSQPQRALRPDSDWRVGPAPNDGDARRAGLAFHWPVQGEVNSPFGRRWGRRHQGIDIRAPRGTLIRAAEAGRVIHSGRGLGGYGRVVIIRHAGGFSTVYAHTNRNYVAVGDRVAKGQRIAEVGSTGNASGPHLHFEVRRERRALDPRAYLPGVSVAAAPAS
jgi:murein DD-endopeptidase MepM/ murein hydrolase activator NlpD